MNRFQDIQAKRFRFINALHENVGGSQQTVLNQWELGEALGLERAETRSIVDYLVGEGLVKRWAMGGSIGITHQGIKEVEQALSQPEQRTEHFPPVVNIINVENMVGSQIQQGTTGSTQTGEFTIEAAKAVRDFVQDLKAKLPELDMQPDDQAEIESDIATVEAQLASPKPKRGIIKESLSSVRNVLEGMTGSIMASEFLRQLPAVLALLA